MILFSSNSNLFNKIKNLKKRDFTDYYDVSRSQLLSNTLIIIGIVSLLYIIFFAYLGLYNLVGIATFSSICIITSYFMRYKSEGRISIYLFFTSTTASIFYTSYILGKDSNIQNLLYVSLVLVFLLIETKKMIDIIIVITISFLAYSILEIYDFNNQNEYNISQNSLSLISTIFKLSSFFLFIIFTIISINNKINAENELKKSKELAEEGLKTKSEFLSSMSHEIRTPMNGIIGFTDLMLQDETNLEKVEKLELVKYSATNLLKIINEILDFSKIEAGKMHFESAAFNLCEQVQDFVKLQEITHQQKDIKFILVLAQDIPAFITGDKFRLNQIILNLVSNAVKFTEKGHIKITVYPIEQTESNVTLNFEIEDTGIGIAPNKLQTIFESFTQETQSTTRQYGGTGLGLSITKQMIELQGGSISAKSIQGVGSTFTISIPFRVSTYEEIFNIPKKIQPTTKSYRHLKGHKILLVEDNILNQKLAEHIFKKWDITYKIANNGMRAIKMLEKEEFACILMDLHMPVINGIDATKIIRNVNSDVINHQTPIIALTADAFEETRVLTSEAGMNYFLSKPFSQDSLLEALLKAVLNTTVDKVNIKRNISPKTEETIVQVKEKHINLNVIKELIGDDNESIMELLNEYIENSPKDYDDLITSLSQTELHKIQSSAHKIKSTFNTFGIKLLAERAKEIEFGAKEGISLERLNELGKDIKLHFFDSLEEAREILQSLK